MSMNQYMHPRNIYKEPPNFKQLALEYPEFCKHTTQDISGKITFNFKSVEALRALSCTLLKKDFNLDVELPLNKLIPTIPLRLNYILWVEDLLNVANCVDAIKGIDIGTGASCIYPLLAAKQHGWAMLATEIDAESISYATRNVQANALTDLIRIEQVSGDNLLLEALAGREAEPFDFCMCNPPFFAAKQELNPFFKARKESRPRPKNGFSAALDEVVAKGGEVEYLSKLIRESKALNAQIKVYTAMVGHKSSLPPLKKLLRECDVASFKQTEFCQGRTTRWGLAWTFLDVDLRRIPDSLMAARQRLARPLRYEVRPNPALFAEFRLSAVAERLAEVFGELQVGCREVRRGRGLLELAVEARADTWSNRRRRRRELERLGRGGALAANNNEAGGVSEACERLEQMEVVGGKKRALDDDSEFYNVKKFRGEGDRAAVGVFLKAGVTLVQIEDCIVLEMVFCEGSATKEGLHQVLQFIKNKWESK